MKTWAALYLMVWLVFLGMLIILFPVFGAQASQGLHGVVGVAVVVLAYYAFRKVQKTSCPDRIKLITRTTTIFAIVAGLIGAILALPGSYALTGSVEQFVLFLHFSLAVAIITQASSSATAYDMWEEREFAQPPTSGPAA